MPGQAGLSLEDTLAALTPSGRRNVLMLLERLRAFADDPDERAAAEHIRELAETAWSQSTSGRPRA